jgi:transcription elongation factor GreB
VTDEWDIEGSSADDGDFDDDDVAETPSVRGPVLITSAGAKRLRDELRDLRTRQRPEVTAIVSWAAGNGDRSENGDYLYGKKKLREIDRRIRFLSKRLESVQVINPVEVSSEQILFGATVTILDGDDRERVFVIVGIDEVDIDKGHVSYASPIGAALLKARVGDVVQYRTPKGVQEIEVIDISYVAVG